MNTLHRKRAEAAVARANPGACTLCAALYPATCPSHTPRAEYVKVGAEHYAKLCEDNLKLRDKLLEIARECAECDGAGCITDTETQRLFPCPKCEDVRELLA